MLWAVPLVLVGYVGYRLVSSEKKIPTIKIESPGSIKSSIKAGQTFQVTLPKHATWNNPPVLSISPTLHVVSQGLAKPLVGQYNGPRGTLTLGWLASAKVQGNINTTIAKTIVVFQ